MKKSLFGLSSEMMNHVVQERWVQALDLCERIYMMLKVKVCETNKEKCNEDSTKA